jgi:nucleoside phosphorylase
MMNQRSTIGVGEPADRACAALIYLLGTERDLAKRQALAQDLQYRALDLGRPQRERIGRFVEAMMVGPDPDAANDLLESTDFRRPATNRVDLAIFVVQPVEWRAVRDVYRIDEANFTSYERRRRYFPTTIQSKQAGRDLSIIVSAVGKDTNIKVGPALQDFWVNYDADAYCLIGMAAGVRDHINLGDVVSPEVVFSYEHGRATPAGVEPRYEQLPTPEEVGGSLFFLDLGATSFEDDMKEIVAQTPKGDRPKLPRAWRPAFRARNAFLASGDKLIVDGRLADMKASYDERTIAGDEESYGFAAYLQGKTWAVFRGIADYGDLSKEDGWQYLSTCAAALIAKHFFAEQYIPPAESRF